MLRHSRCLVFFLLEKIVWWTNMFVICDIPVEDAAVEMVVSGKPVYTVKHTKDNFPEYLTDGDIGKFCSSVNSHWHSILVIFVNSAHHNIMELRQNSKTIESLLLLQICMNCAQIDTWHTQSIRSENRKQDFLQHLFVSWNLMAMGVAIFLRLRHYVMYIDKHSLGIKQFQTFARKYRQNICVI